MKSTRCLQPGMRRRLAAVVAVQLAASLAPPRAPSLTSVPLRIVPEAPHATPILVAAWAAAACAAVAWAAAADAMHETSSGRK